MKIKSIWYALILEKFVALLLVVYPSAFLLVKGGMNGAMILMLGVALLVWLFPPANLPQIMWKNEWWKYVAAMFGMSLAILISQLANNELLARPHDAASRYWLAIPIFMLALRLRPGVFSAMQYGFPLAAILCWLFAVNDANGPGSGFSLPGLNKVLFGDYLLLFGALSLFSLDWFGKDAWVLRMFKWMGFAFGLVAAIQSGTRGALLAIPVFILLYLLYRGIRLTFRVLAISALLGVAAISVIYMSSQTMQQRIEELSNDIATYQRGNRDTSTGLRWQLNMAAIEIFLRNPIAGVGPKVGFDREMQKLLEEGKLTPVAAELGRCCHPHNDLLAKAADLGVIGLAALLALYFVPMHMFWKAMRSDQREVKISGLLGITLVCAHIVFGLTAGLLGLTMTAAFYAFSVSMLLAASCNSQNSPLQKHGN